MDNFTVVTSVYGCVMTGLVFLLSWKKDNKNEQRLSKEENEILIDDRIDKKLLIYANSLEGRFVKLQESIRVDISNILASNEYRMKDSISRDMNECFVPSKEIDLRFENVRLRIDGIAAQINSIETLARHNAHGVEAANRGVSIAYEKVDKLADVISGPKNGI